MQIDQSKLDYIRTYMARDRASNEPCVCRSVHGYVDHLLGLVDALRSQLVAAQSTVNADRQHAARWGAQQALAERRTHVLAERDFTEEQIADEVKRIAGMMWPDPDRSTTDPSKPSSLTERVMTEIRSSVPQGEDEG